MSAEEQRAAAVARLAGGMSLDGVELPAEGARHWAAWAAEAAGGEP